MGCFLACFGGAKNRKRRRRPPNKSLPVDRACESYKPLQSPSTKQLAPNLSPEKKFVSEAVVGSTPEPRGDKQEQGSFRSSKKKVTFDLNVKTYEQVLIDEDPKHSSEGEVIEEERKPEVVADDKSIAKSGAFLLNHRYQNCGSSDDDDIGYGDEEEEEEEEDYVDPDFDEEADNIVDTEGNDEETYDSYFSPPMEKEQQCIQEVNSPKSKSVSSPDRQPSLLAKCTARDRSQYVHAVLNPVENLTQWKEVKGRASPSKNQKEESINSDMENKLALNPEPKFKIEKSQKLAGSNPRPNCPAKHDIPVDASLSNWLVSLDNSAKEGLQQSSSHLSNSPVSREEKPILGALTVEDIKQSSVTSSPRRSPSRSPDEIPIVVTVGSYWSCNNQISDSGSSCQSGSKIKGIPNTTSKYREDKRVNWHAAPLEARLGGTLNKGAA